MNKLHPSVMAFGLTELTRPLIEGQRVIEIGSRDINGSLAPHLRSYNPAEYIGTDMEHGKGVDVVLPVEKLLDAYGEESFDVVISTEMLEHARDWRTAVDVMKRLCKVGGRLLVTTRSPGFPLHGFPEDYWRFTCQDFHRIFGDFSKRVIDDPDPTHPGVLMRGVRVHRKRIDLRGLHVVSVDRG